MYVAVGGPWRYSVGGTVGHPINHRTLYTHALARFHVLPLYLVWIYYFSFSYGARACALASLLSLSLYAYPVSLSQITLACGRATHGARVCVPLSPDEEQNWPGREELDIVITTLSASDRPELALQLSD